jgi:hypothetical protein
MTTTYEWVIETLEDEGEDIAEVNHAETYAEALRWASSIEGRYDIGLVRDVGNDLVGITDRAWAYVKEGALPETFSYGAGEDSGIRVPKRFHEELARG